MVDSTRKYLQERGRDVSECIWELKQLCSSGEKRRILSAEQLLSIQKFSCNCHQYINNGAAITRSIPLLKPWTLIQLDDTMKEMRNELRIIDELVFPTGDCSSSNLSLVGGAAGGSAVAGALKGAIVGAPLCGMDAGIVVGIGAIVGFLAILASQPDKVESNEVKILLPNLANLVENVKRMNGLMREAYGMSIGRNNKGEDWGTPRKGVD